MRAQSVTCSSCRGNFASQEEFVTLKPCKHIFHQACVQNGPNCQTCSTPMRSREIIHFDNARELNKGYLRKTQVEAYNASLHQRSTPPQTFGDALWRVGTQMFTNFVIAQEEEQAVQHDANIAFVDLHVTQLRNESGRDRYLYIHHMPESGRLLRLLEDPNFSTDETRQILSDYNRWNNRCNLGILAASVMALSYLYFYLPLRS